MTYIYIYMYVYIYIYIYIYVCHSSIGVRPVAELLPEAY